MLSSRGLTAAVAASIALLVAGCSDDEPSPTPTPTPSRSATADPAGHIVPLDGDQNLRIEWTLEKAASADDPVVEVARRTVVLSLLGKRSPLWTTDRTYASASKALTTTPTVLDYFGELTPNDRPADPILKGRVRALLSAPRNDGGKTALVYACLDQRKVIGPPSNSPGPTTVRIDLKEQAGTWRASSVDANFNVGAAPGVSSFIERCKKF